MLEEAQAPPCAPCCQNCGCVEVPHRTAVSTAATGSTAHSAAATAARSALLPVAAVLTAVEVTLAAAVVAAANAGFTSVPVAVCHCDC